MSFNELSPNEEQALQKIIEEPFEYWEKWFENASFQEEAQMKSIWKKLSEGDYISICPGNFSGSVPEYVLLNNGKEYFNEKERNEKKQRQIEIKKLKGNVISGAIGAIIVKVLDWLIPRIPLFLDWLKSLKQ